MCKARIVADKVITYHDGLLYSRAAWCLCVGDGRRNANDGTMRLTARNVSGVNNRTQPGHTGHYPGSPAAWAAGSEERRLSGEMLQHTET